MYSVAVMWRSGADEISVANGGRAACHKICVAGKVTGAKQIKVKPFNSHPAKSGA
ncbi:MAG: hypothetical protein ACE5EN_01825 [Nitrospinota bacterium]